MMTTTPHLFYWSDVLDGYVRVPASADTAELRALIDFDGMSDDDEAVVRFRRVELVTGNATKD